MVVWGVALQLGKRHASPSFIISSPDEDRSDGTSQIPLLQYSGLYALSHYIAIRERFTLVALPQEFTKPTKERHSMIRSAPEPEPVETGRD